MGNIIIGVLFIIGGMSGNFVLRGTNSSEGLILVGVGLIIWGIIQLSRGAAKQDSFEAPSTESNGERIPFSEVETPSQMTNQRVYYKDTHGYIGKIAGVDESNKMVKIKDDFGKEISKTYNDIEVLEKV